MTNTTTEPGRFAPAPAPTLRCDFCGVSGQPRDSLTWHPARSFSQLTVLRPGQIVIVPCACHYDMPAIGPDDEMHEYISVSAWVGCRECSALITEGDVEGLALRAVRRHAGEGASPAQARRIVMGVMVSHGSYWRHREPES